MRGYRSITGRTLLLTLLFCWPLLLFGRPSYISDSSTYYKGGKVAVEFAFGKLLPSPSAISPAAGAARSAVQNGTPENQSAEQREIKGARSISYSVLAYLSGAFRTDLLLLALVQSAILALTAAIFAQAIGLTNGRDFGLWALVVAFATPAACFANLAIPDIFAGILLVILILLYAYIDTLAVSTRLVLVAIAAFCVSSHASHPPLAVGLWLLAAVWQIASGSKARLGLAPLAWMAAPIAMGVLATITLNFVGFGESSIAAKRYPLTLARSVADGPARWYLEEECKKPRYAICEVFGTQFPRDVPSFLWPPTGLKDRVTGAQMDRIRAEEEEIVLNAAKRYPAAQLDGSLRNVAGQLVGFRLTETQFNQQMIWDREGEGTLRQVDNKPSLILDIVELLSYVTAGIALIWAFARFFRAPPQERAAILLLLGGLVGNAIICAVFSGVADRYQARVIWALPMFALAAGLVLRSQARLVKQGQVLSSR